jgi:hypothetical protein
MNITELYNLVKEDIEFIKKPLFILIDERTKELKEKVEPKLEKIDTIEKN